MEQAMRDALDGFWGAAATSLSLALGLLLLLTGAAMLLKGRRRSGRDWSADQLRAVEAGRFERVPLLNAEEARLLPVLERAAEEAGPGFRVMAQVSLGEVIRPVDRRDAEARAAVNAKRLDFGLFDAAGLLVCAVEYQGTGHWQGNARGRDAVKRVALGKAGVRLIEVHPGDSPSGLLRAVREALARAA